MNSLEEIIKAIMVEVEANPSAPIEEVLRNFAKKNNISKETQDEIEKGLGTLTKIDETYHNLKDVREDGKERSEWVKEQLTATAEKFSNQQEKTNFINLMLERTMDVLKKFV
jgi:uncharacterized membrane protein YgaE (UPF0421/DUF939 family)